MRPKPLIATLTAIVGVGWWTLGMKTEVRGMRFGKCDAQNVPESAQQ
jgi:hypothetical protein